MKFLVLFITLFLSNIYAAKLLDKTVAIFNDQVITLSQVQRIRSSLDARRNIAPQIYTTSSMNNLDIARIRLQRLMVRAQLATRNIVITDDQVEAQVNATYKRLGISKDILLKFLKQGNLTYDEYFELTRESIEHNYFIAQIIQPLITITDQEVKNEYYKKGSGSKATTYKYNLIDFKVKKTPSVVKYIKKIKEVIIGYRKNGSLPKVFADMKTQTMDEVPGEGINKRLRKVLDSTPKGGYTQPVLLGNTFHVFYIKSKEQDASDDFESSKNRIRAKLFNEALDVVTKNWFESEARKHYIKFFL